MRVCCVLHTIGLDWMSAGSVFVEEVNMIGFYSSCSTRMFWNYQAARANTVPLLFKCTRGIETLHAIKYDDVVVE